MVGISNDLDLYERHASGWWDEGDRNFRSLRTVRIVGEKMNIIGFHLPGGGIGRAEASADGFRFISEET